MRFDTYRLGDILNIKYGKNQKKVKDENGKYPILGTGGLMGFANDFLYDKPSVLIGRKGSISKVRFASKPFWTVDTLFYTEINEDIAYPKYIYYCLSLIDFNHYNEGTTIPSLRTQTLQQIKISLPNKQEQLKVLKILNAIELKIELNNSMIDNLEKLAQTLFKRWFVDFEFPDENGKPYKSSGGEMVESELGYIPKDWEILSLNSIAPQTKDTFNPSKEKNTKVAHFSFPAFDTIKYPVIEESKTIKSNKYFIDKWSVMFSRMNPKTPRVWLPNIIEELPNISSSEFVVLDTKKYNNKAFIYSLISSKEFNNFLISNQTGSTNSRQRVRANTAISYKLAVNRFIINNFEAKIIKLINIIIILRNENESLSELRDTLLPKLLSGEIEFPEENEVHDDVPIS